MNQNFFQPALDGNESIQSETFKSMFAEPQNMIKDDEISDEEQS